MATQSMVAWLLVPRKHTFSDVLNLPLVTKAPARISSQPQIRDLDGTDTKNSSQSWHIQTT